MAPEVAREGWSCAREPDALVLSHPARGEVVLLGVAARLYDLADGRRGVGELAAVLEAVPEDIFAALDELADHGLLVRRIAPPTAVRARTRREVLATFGGAAVALAAGPTLAAPPVGSRERDDLELASRPPREQVHKEGAAKAEQQRKLDAPRELARTVVAEENRKAEVDLLGAFAAAARRVDSPAEVEDKRAQGLPPELARAREAERKQAVQALDADEQAARSDVDALTRAVTGPVADLSAREQQAKLAGEFGVAHEEAHRALVTAQERRRKQPDAAGDEQLRRARQARWQADIVDGRREEQDDKTLLRAREARSKRQISEQPLEHAEAQRDGHRAERREQFQQRRAELAAEAQARDAAARTSAQAEQRLKARAAERAREHDTVRVELRAREHAAKSKPDAG